MMILKSIFLLIAITYVSAELGSFEFPECSKPNEPVYGGDPCQVCTCTHQLKVNCTIRPICLTSNAANVPVLKSPDNVQLTKDAKETKIKTENVTPAKDESSCVPGTFYRKYCNTCKCFPNGRPGCTQKFCHSNIYNADGTLVKSKSPKEEFDSFTNLNLHGDKDNGYYSYEHFDLPKTNVNIESLTGDKIINTVIDTVKKIDPLSIQQTMEELKDY